MSISVGFYEMILLLGGVMALLSGFVVFVHNSRDLLNQIWLALSASTAVWGFGYFSMIISPNREIAWISSTVFHIAAIFIPLFYYYFTLHLTGTFERYKMHFYAATGFALLFLLINQSPVYIRDVVPKASFPFVSDAGSYYWLFAVYFFFLAFYSLFQIIKKFRTLQDYLERRKYTFVILSTIAGFIGGGSAFLLTFNIVLPPYAIILFALYPIITAYAIFQYNLFNVRTLAAEFLISILWLSMFTRTILSESTSDQIVNTFLLLIAVIIGMMIIRSDIREVEAKKAIEKLVEELKEQDRQKTEFISFATHQLRSPLTAVRGFTSLILDGDYGAVPETLKDPIEKVSDSTRQMVSVVDDYLNIARMELGTMKYNFISVDLKKITEKVVAELQTAIKRAGLQIELTVEGQNFVVSADSEKLEQAVTNLIDNAVKYTPKGSINLMLKEDAANKKILFTIKDTGIGIPADILPKLFSKFIRGNVSGQTNPGGSGLGLYLAKQIVDAHGGRIWAESKGENAGSAFFVELESAK